MHQFQSITKIFLLCKLNYVDVIILSSNSNIKQWLTIKRVPVNIYHQDNNITCAWKTQKFSMMKLITKFFVLNWSVSDFYRQWQWIRTIIKRKTKRRKYLLELWMNAEQWLWVKQKRQRNCSAHYCVGQSIFYTHLNFMTAI